MSEIDQMKEDSHTVGDDTNASISEDPSNSTAPQNTESNKITILLKAVSNTPMLKKSKWVVDSNKSVSSVISFVKKYIRLQASESLFLYVNQSFAPSPDQLLKSLYDCFNTDGKLILYYSKSQAWG